MMLPADHDDRTASFGSAGRPTSAASSPGRLLVVDDERFLRNAVAASLRRRLPDQAVRAGGTGRAHPVGVAPGPADGVQLLDHVWDYGGTSTVVATYIAYLRRKLAQFGPELIHTQRGVGYSLRLPRSDGQEHLDER